MGFEGRSVLVTGAGKGIGRATVKMLVAKGATVVALSRSVDDLASLEAETGCRTIAVDLGQAEAWSTAPAPQSSTPSSTCRPTPSTASWR